MTPVDEAVERVRSLGNDLRAYADNCVDARYWGGPTIYPKNPITEDRAAKDARAIRALLSALELGRQAQQSPAGLGLHPLRSDLAEALRLVDSVHLGLSLAASQPVPMPEGGFRCTLHPTRANASVECLEKAIALLKAALSPTTPQGGES